MRVKSALPPLDALCQALDVDAETYLRCRLEDALTDGRRSARDLHCRVRAALAVGAVDDDVAESVLADAEKALRLRNSFDRYDDDDDDGADGSIAPRVVVRPTRIVHDWGWLVVTHLVLGEHETTIGAYGELAEPAARRRDHHEMPWEPIEVVDARGSTFAASFSGSSSGTTFDGEYSCHPPLDVTSSSVTIAGHRFDLDVPPELPTVRVVNAIEELSRAERAARHVALLSNGPTHHHGEEDEDGIVRETFAGLGITVPAAVPGVAPAGSGRRGRRPSRLPTSGWIGIGATAGPVDGTELTVVALSGDGTLMVLGRTVGRSGGGERPLFSIDAVDDLGNRYSTQPSGSSGGGGAFSGRVRFTPDLAARAAGLTIGIDTLRHRLEVDVLLDWQEVR